MGRIDLTLYKDVPSLRVYGLAASVLLMTGGVLAGLGACVDLAHIPKIHVTPELSASPAPAIPTEVRDVLDIAFSHRYLGGELFFVCPYTMQQLIDASVFSFPVSSSPSTVLDTQYWVVVCRDIPGQPGLQVRYIVDLANHGLLSYVEAHGVNLVIGDRTSVVPAEILRTYHATVPSTAPTTGSFTPSPG